LVGGARPSGGDGLIHGSRIFLANTQWKLWFAVQLMLLANSRLDS
jgi:hypothetical protein